MSWTLIAGCVLGVWGMLTAFGGERRRQLNDIEARKHAEAEAQHSEPEKK